MAGLVLEIVEGESAGTTFELAQPLEIGRERGLGITLDDLGISRRHARISPADEAAVVEDLGSQNGSYVNEQPIDGPREVGPGDRLRCGLTVFELRSAQEAARGLSGVLAVPPITELDDGVLAPVPMERGDQFERVAALKDPRVKQRTSVAAFALLGSPPSRCWCSSASWLRRLDRAALGQWAGFTFIRKANPAHCRIIAVRQLGQPFTAQ